MCVADRGQSLKVAAAAAGKGGGRGEGRGGAGVGKLSTFDNPSIAIPHPELINLPRLPPPPPAPCRLVHQAVVDVVARHAAAAEARGHRKAHKALVAANVDDVAVAEPLGLEQLQAGGGRPGSSGRQTWKARRDQHVSDRAAPPSHGPG